MTVFRNMDSLPEAPPQKLADALLETPFNPSKQVRECIDYIRVPLIDAAASGLREATLKFAFEDDHVAQMTFSALKQQGIRCSVDWVHDPERPRKVVYRMRLKWGPTWWQRLFGRRGVRGTGP